MAFASPVKQMIFALKEMANYSDLVGSKLWPYLNDSFVETLLNEAAKLADTSIAPLNQSADKAGSILKNGQVSTAPGFKEAYKELVNSSWGTVSGLKDYGGQGLPKTLAVMIQELWNTSCMSFSLCPMLTQGAIEAISHHGTDAQKNEYLPKLLTGEWSGTMNLTEPQAGSDVGALKTSAKRNTDGSYSIKGTKIYITFGEHDMAENIIHLVLARVDDSPAGTKGISLFLVPKFIVKEDGNVGPRNGISTGSIETKMGIKGSATCVLNFDEATGYMIGDKEKGLSAMFTMMNLERIVVGIQGLGISEIAYQNSLSYAKERKQGKSNNSKSKNGADFIIEHADIRRSLLNMKSIIEGERALCFWLSQQTEVSLYHPDEKARREASDYVSLMTPVVKSLFTDLAMEITSDAMQIYGGYGYTKDQGIEQLYRDNRITPIYEGTNSVQAADLVFRKLSNKNGDVINKFLDQVKNECNSNNEKIRPFISDFNNYLDILKKFSDWMIEKSKTDKDDVSAAANDYLKTLGFVSIAYAWIKVLEVSFKDYNENKNFYDDKIDTARFYFDKVLPRAEQHYKSAISGSSNIMNFKFN